MYDVKIISYINYLMVGFPISLILADWIFESDIIIIGLLFTVLTGGFQIIVGIGMFIDSGCKNPLYAIYLAIVFIFFMLWAFTNCGFIIVLPPALAIYLSTLLFIDAKKQKS